MFITNEGLKSIAIEVEKLLLQKSNKSNREDVNKIISVNRISKESRISRCKVMSMLEEAGTPAKSINNILRTTVNDWNRALELAFKAKKSTKWEDDFV